MEAELVEERVWERRREFIELNTAGTTPVFQEQNGLAVPGAGPISEYLDETRGLALGDRRLLPEGPGERVEVRRLLDWFNIKFHEEITGPLVLEKVMKRFMSRDDGGGSPDMSTIRAARANVRYHLRYIFLAAGQAELARGGADELCRSRGGGASVLRRLSRRRALGRG